MPEDAWDGSGKDVVCIHVTFLGTCFVVIFAGDVWIHEAGK